MKVDRRIAIVAVCVIAASLASCKKDVTAPVVARTYSVAATAQVPAAPTAPVTISTNDPGSHVAATLSVAQLQSIVTAAGGPVTIKMTDVGSTDFSTLPASVVATLKPNDVVIVFSTTLASGATVSPSATANISIPVSIQETADQAAFPFVDVTFFQGTQAAGSLAELSSASRGLPVLRQLSFAQLNNNLSGQLLSLLLTQNNVNIHNYGVQINFVTASASASIR